MWYYANLLAGTPLERLVAMAMPAGWSSSSTRKPRTSSAWPNTMAAAGTACTATSRW
jgi:hypothetical protein